jgi:hypothetical protein
MQRRYNNAKLDSQWKLDETATNNATIDLYAQTLSTISGLTLYERVMNGDSIRVKLKCPLKKQRKEAFTVKPLYLMSPTQYVTKSSAYFKWSYIGGIWIGRSRHALTDTEMIEWFEHVEEVKQ